MLCERHCPVVVVAACFLQAFLKAASGTNEALMILTNALYMLEALQHLVHAQYTKVWATVAVLPSCYSPPCSC